MKLIIIDTNIVKEITQEELKELKDIDQISIIEYCRLKANPVENRVSQPSETIPCEQKCDACNGWKKINDIYGECNTLRTSPYEYVIGEYKVENSEYETNQILTHKDFCCRLFANKR
jgi:hypothetical protein